MAAETPDATGSGWRQRWAERENGARRQTYDAALEPWRRRDAELRELRTAAAGVRGSADPAAVPWLAVQPDEVVLFVLPEAHLVEAEDAGPLPAPDHTRFPYLLDVADPGLLPRGVVPTDTGTAAVTTRRVAFQGRGTREWDYAWLEGVHHDPATPLSLLGVGNRTTPSGLLMTEAQAADFRFNLTLGIANATGRRPDFVALLDGLIAAHQSLAPAVPVPVTGRDAPRRARLASGRVVLAAVSAAVLLIIGGSALPGLLDARSTATSVAPQPPAPDGLPLNTSADPVATTADPTAVDASPTPGGPATPTPTATPPPRSATPKPPAPTSPPKPQPTTASPTPAGADLCGAPANPYGYNFCHGDVIRHPPSDVCRYFACTSDFGWGDGYMIQCRDGLFSMSGGRQESCWRHDGNRRVVYQ